MKLLKLSYIQEQHDAAERQLKSLKKVDSLDFGPDQEYYSLNGECYHFTEKYNYKLCPFDKSEQDGTSLGNHKVKRSNQNTRFVKALQTSVSMCHLLR